MPVFFRYRYHEEVIGENRREKQRQDDKHKTPCRGHALAVLFKHACKNDKSSLPDDARYAVECGSDSDICGLVVWIKLDHVVTVRSYVVRSREESHQPEAGQSGGEEERGRKKKSRCSRRQGYRKLHRYSPFPFGADKIYKRTPERLYDPRQIKPSGIEGHLRKTDPHIGVHEHSQHIDREIGESLGHVECWNPCPWRTSFRLFADDRLIHIVS